MNAITRNVGEVRRPFGIWIRVSTENQAQGDSPEHHEQRARLFAEAKGWEVREVYRLEAVSGKSVMDHAEAKRMLVDLRRGHITGLIFSKLARLARNTKQLLEFADIFRDSGADLVSLQESIDTSTPAGRLFYSMIAAMAQWEREEIADRINASIAIRAKLGKPLNGKAPFGYHWVDKKLIPHTAEVPVRRLMYELYAEHQRKKKVCRLLNQAGHRTRDGHQWSDTSLERLLQDTTAKGMYRANHTKRAGNGRVAKKPEDQWVWIPCEPVVSEELWDRCNSLLDQNHQHQRKGRSPVQLFAGLTYCHCGRKMYVPSNTPKYVCQHCRNKIPVIDLEAIFVEQLKNFFLSPEEISRQLEAADQNLTEKEHLLSVLGGELEKLEQEIVRVYRLYQDEKLDGDGFARFYRPLDERRKQLEAELPRLQAELDLLKIDHLSADQVVSEAQDLYGRWDHLEREEKHRVIQSITERIVIGPGDQIAINLCHFGSAEEMTKEQRKLAATGR
jgi:site-specific DNA recombinase